MMTERIVVQASGLGSDEGIDGALSKDTSDDMYIDICIRMKQGSKEPSYILVKFRYHVQ